MKLTPNQFEGLTQCQMEWATESDWLKQKDRFEDTLNEYNDSDDEITFPEWVSQCTIHEIGAGKKIK